VLSRISFCKSDSHPLQDTAPCAVVVVVVAVAVAVVQFMMGAVKTRGDADMAHLQRMRNEAGIVLEQGCRAAVYMENSVLNSSSVMFWGLSLALAHCPRQPVLIITENPCVIQSCVGMRS
jgi:hypothetical protein